jgi:hypothetical protein
MKIITKNRRDVIELAGTTDETSGCIDDGLKTISLSLRNTSEGNVAVVDARKYECLNQLTLGISRKRTGD